MSRSPNRLLTLLSLLQTPRPWSGGQLADRLEVSRRTVRRDIERLRDLGYPVAATLGVDGGYRLVAGMAMPPLVLDDDEAVAIAIGLRTVATQAVAGVDEASVRALAKLEQVLPVRLRPQVAAVARATTVLPGASPTIDPEVLTTISRAIVGSAGLRFAYGAGDGTVTRRRVEPERLVVAARRWYLVAWDADREDWRLFRVDRMRDPWSPPGRTEPRTPPDGGGAAWAAQRLYESAPTHRAVVTLESPAARIRPAIGDADILEPIDDRSVCVTLAADTLPWLVARILAFGCEFVVHEPAELVADLRSMARRIDRAVEPRT